MQEQAQLSNPRFQDISQKHGIETRHLEALGMTKHCLLIVDYEWYGQNQNEIDDWIKRTIPDSWRNGMIIMFANEQEKMLFLLRWQK